MEARLRDLVQTMQAAWQQGPCGPSCTLGEMTALAAATLAFYHEQRKNMYDHWTNYQKP